MGAQSADSPELFTTLPTSGDALVYGQGLPCAAGKSITDALYDSLPIGRLPVEILRLVFQLDWCKDRPFHGYARVHKCWMRLAHVCSTWRLILLDMPLLWARDVLVFGLRHSWFRDIVDRTQGAPLDLDFEYRGLHRDDYDIVRAYFGRARKLKFSSGSLAVVSGAIHRISGRALPLLESLDIRASFPARDAEQVDTGSLAGATNLSELRMFGVYLRAPVNGNLIQLEIHLPQESQRPSVDDLLYVLSQNSNLETLDLRDAFHDHTEVKCASRVALLALLECTINLYEHASLAPVFVGLLHMPGVQKLRVAGDWCAQTGADGAALLGATLAAAGGAPALAHSDLRVEQKHGYLLLVLTSSALVTWHTRGLTFRLPLNAPDDPAVARVVAHLADTAVPGRVLRLRLALARAEEHALPAWRALLPLCARARRLCLDVSVRRARAVLEFLARERAAGGALPLLREVELTCVLPRNMEVKRRKLNELAGELQVALEIQGRLAD